MIKFKTKMIWWKNNDFSTNVINKNVKNKITRQLSIPSDKW